MQRAIRLLRTSLSGPVITSLALAFALACGVAAHRAVPPVYTAATHVFVDTAEPSVVHRPVYPVSALAQRAELLGREATSPPAVEQLGRMVGVAPSRISASARSTAHVPAAYTEPGSEERAAAILTEDRPYGLEVEGRQTTPVLDIYARAPTAAKAVAMADAAVAILRGRVHTIGDASGVPSKDRIVLRQLGGARGGVANAGMAGAIGGIGAIVGFAVAFFGLRALRRRDADVDRRPVAASRGGAWPRTTRLTPWLLAGFWAVVWLMPFDEILLNISAPIDLTFDRIVLPFVVGMWLLAALVGGAVAPRLRMTRIHAAVGAFVLCAFLSVVLNAASLNQTLELGDAVKRLPLLISYIFVFVVAASAVRACEVRPFMTYTLILSVICAVGVIYEYRFKQNLFYQWSDKLLPGIFHVAPHDSAAVDDQGRRVVQGPAEVPLETVAMLAMALPIALVRLIGTGRQRDRVLYGLAALLLFAAAVATYRKSALLAPTSVVATLAYFRRRELLRLAPLGLVLVLVIPVLAPGAVRQTTSQFEPGQLGVATVSDRSSDYDAVRPDVWTHLLFGRGWGTYNHVTYRVLDSEILHRLIEMGALGLISYLFMIGSVVWAARATIDERDAEWAPLALIGAAAAVAFAVVSTLFDVVSFPHAVYIFLCMAGLVSVVIGRDHREEAAEPEPRARLALVPPAPLSPAPRPLATATARRSSDAAV